MCLVYSFNFEFCLIYCKFLLQDRAKAVFHRKMLNLFRKQSWNLQ